MKKFLTTLFCLLSITTAAVAQHDTIRLLAIGNSFSEDAVEQHLYPIAAADNTVMIIGNLYIGGCSIERHVSNIEHDAPAYSYRKIGADGVKTTYDSTRLSQAIVDEPWDFVSVQQVSGLSGIPESYNELPTLVDWVRNIAPQAEVAFHQTWAYAADSRHKDFARYSKSQDTMSCKILKATKQAAASVGIRRVIPCLRAISSARLRTPELFITRDGYHLDRTYGRYIASATWYGALTGRPVLGNQYCPAGVTQADLEWAQRCADHANIPLDSLINKPIDTTFSTNPKFPGGDEAFYQQLSRYLRYPHLAIEHNTQGRVVISFVVERDGTLSNYKIEEDPGDGCGQAAIDALMKVDKKYHWTPAYIDGIPMRTMWRIPVNFELR